MTSWALEGAHWELDLSWNIKQILVSRVILVLFCVFAKLSWSSWEGVILKCLECFWNYSPAAMPGSSYLPFYSPVSLPRLTSPPLTKPVLKTYLPRILFRFPNVVRVCVILPKHPGKVSPNILKYMWQPPSLTWSIYPSQVQQLSPTIIVNKLNDSVHLT